MCRGPVFMCRGPCLDNRQVPGAMFPSHLAMFACITLAYIKSNENGCLLLLCDRICAEHLYPGTTRNIPTPDLITEEFWKCEASLSKNSSILSFNAPGWVVFSDSVASCEYYLALHSPHIHPFSHEFVVTY